MDTADTQQDRRSFLDILLGLSLVGWLASAAYPVVRYLKPLPQIGPTGPTKLTRAEQGKLQQHKFVIVPSGPKRVLVFTDAKDKLRALDARCTHEGCTVQYVPGESVVWCACHNAKFDLEGRVLSGPPPRPLPRFLAEKLEDGSIAISAEKA